MDVKEKGDGMSDVAKSSFEDDNLSGNLEHDFTTKTWREDFCFIVEDKRLYVAKLILGLASPVFERMFQAEFKEMGEAEMALPGKKFEDMQEFLRCIYPSVMKDVTIKNAHEIIALAEEYQVVALKSKCEACFLQAIGKKTSAVMLCELLNTACLFSLQDLFHKCTALAAEKSLAVLDEAECQTPIPSKANTVIQREIISKMEKKQAETNLIVDNLKAELQRVLTMNNYRRAYAPEGERLSFDKYIGWSGTSLFLQIDTKMKSNSFTVEICRTEAKLEFEISDGGYLRLILLATAPSQIKLTSNIVIANGIKGKNDFCKTIQQSLSKRPCYCYIIETNILLDEKEGYIFHGKADVEVHLLAK